MTQASLLTARVPAPPQAGRYRCIIADPPWLERGGGQIKRGADRHYPLMPTAQIEELPVSEWAAPDAHLYLWVTNNFVPSGLDVMASWGFRYVTTLTWVKGERDICDIEDSSLQVGLGQYFRGCTEHVLFGVRGACEYRDVEGKRAQGLTAFFARRGEHSVKPEELRRMAELVSHGPRLEMFARRAAEGWDAWGLEAPGAAA
jgi:N6-adenosine-specific RNA methylase IME4